MDYKLVKALETMRAAQDDWMIDHRETFEPAYMQLGCFHGTILDVREVSNQFYWDAYNRFHYVGEG